jgi:hypothetical protein
MRGLPTHTHRLDLLLSHPLLSLSLPLVSPPRKWRPPINHIPDRPQHALFVRLLADIVIWANDVKLAIGHFLDHVICNLFARPRTVWLLLFRTWDVARLDEFVRDCKGKGWRNVRDQ